MTTTADLPTAATVYVPREGSRLEAILQPGTGIVGSNAEAWLARRYAEPSPSNDAGALTLDYEPITAAGNIVTFADRVYHAFDRHVRHFPTHKRLVAQPDQLWPVAFYWRPEGRVEISGSGCGTTQVIPDGQALYKLAAWIGMPLDGSRAVASVTDPLAAQLRATHRVTA